MDGEDGEGQGGDRIKSVTNFNFMLIDSMCITAGNSSSAPGHSFKSLVSMHGLK